MTAISVPLHKNEGAFLQLHRDERQILLPIYSLVIEARKHKCPPLPKPGACMLFLLYTVSACFHFPRR